MSFQIVVVARPSSELDLAMDAQDHICGTVLRFSECAEAATSLLSQWSPQQRSPVRVVFIELGDTTTGASDLINGLRSDPVMAAIPVVLWGSAEALLHLDLDDGVQPNSFVPVAADSRTKPLILAQTIHFWTVVNRAPVSKVSPVGQGGTT